MNQLSYKVKNKRLDSLKFKFKGQIKNEIINTIDHINYKSKYRK